MSTCCFTGHRKISDPELKQLLPALINEIENLYAQGVTVFRNGGALGFDTFAAICVMGLKKKHPEVKLIMDVPHKGQECLWSEKEKEVYQYIIKCADEVNILSDRYRQGCMHHRNRYMVDRSDFIIAYIRHARGGSYYTASYAEAQGKKVIYI